MPRLHDDETDTDAELVRTLLREAGRPWHTRPVREVVSSGGDNAMYRVGDDLVARLPRTDRAARSLERELEHLDALARILPVEVPEVVLRGDATAGFPYPWTVLRWLEGRDAWEARGSLEPPDDLGLADDLAEVVADLRRASLPGVPRRSAGQRGGPLAGVLERAHRWVDGGDGPVPPTVDVDRVRGLLRRLPDAADDGVAPVLTHGDLIPDNLLVRDRRLAAVVDWGSVSTADPALDLVPAWAVLGPQARRRFRTLLSPDDATWERARANALEQALGAVVYYTPRRHALADVMGRTLRRILDDVT